jgi:hypothetical protein
MTNRAIAIVGSADEKRTYDPPIPDPLATQDMAKKLGDALARAGYGLIVYSASPGLIERYVVNGFVASGKAKPRSIIVFSPFGSTKAAAFVEREKHDELFDIRQDNNTGWEVSFFRSLSRTDGVVMIGGGQSTLITGVLALTYRIPLLALSAYGGNASKVWASLVAGRDLPTQEQIHAMADLATPEVIKKWLQSLEAQFAAKKAEQREQAHTWPAVTALFVLIFWVSALPLGFLLVPTVGNGNVAPSGWHGTLFLFLLFLSPLLAGGSGATIRTLLPAGARTATPTLRTGVLGVAAGALASLLYILGQLVGNPYPYNFVVLAFSVVFGFIAGFTSDSVFKKLESVQALKTDVLTLQKD